MNGDVSRSIDVPYLTMPSRKQDAPQEEFKSKFGANMGHTRSESV